MNKELIKKAHEIRAKYSELLAMGATFNEILVAEYKKETNAQEFKTFARWKNEGYKVKKGSKGLPAFSQPVKGNEEEAKKFFFTAYLFNENQVEKITK